MTPSKSPRVETLFYVLSPSGETERGCSLIIYYIVLFIRLFVEECDAEVVEVEADD